MCSLIVYFSVVVIRSHTIRASIVVPSISCQLKYFVLQYLFVKCMSGSLANAFIFLLSVIYEPPCILKDRWGNENCAFYKHWGCERPPVPGKKGNLGNRGGLSRVAEVVRQPLV